MPRESKPKSTTNALNRAVAADMADFLRKASMPRQPVTDQRIAAIWPAWCALPSDFDPAERDAILGGRQLHYGDYQHHNDRLREQFEHLVPLDDAEYHETIKALSEWWRIIHGARACIAANRAEIERQLRFEAFDKNLVGFMASYRMLKELDATRPDLTQQDKIPTLADLAFIRARRDAYARSRTDAVEILSGLIFAPTLLAEHDLQFEDQAFEFSQTRFPRHLFIARLKAFGKCSDRLFAWFMEHDFNRLSDAERVAFTNECSAPKVSREDYSYLRLWAWLADNAPVFNSFKAGWPGIFKEVALRFKPGAPDGCRSHPSDYESLKIQWRDFTKLHGLSDPPRIALPIGKPSKDRPAIPSDLLSPVPDFSIAR